MVKLALPKAAVATSVMRTKPHHLNRALAVVLYICTTSAYAQQSASTVGLGGIPWRSSKAEVVQQFSGKLDDSYCKKPKLPANPTSLDHKRYEVDTLAYQAMAELITSSKLDCGNVQAPILLGGQRGEADFTFTDAGELFMSSAKVKAKPESTLSLVSTYVRLHKELSNSYGSPSYVSVRPSHP